MGYQIRAARPEERRGVFRGRYEVYVEEMGAMPPNPWRVIRDRFDDRPGTLNLAVFDGERIVGGARWVADRGEGTTADAYYDFSPHLPEGALRGAGSMLWMAPEARGQRGLIGELMAEGLSWCIEEGISHVLATVNPPVASRFARVGYRPVGSPFVHDSGLPVQPMMLETGVLPAVAMPLAA
jgi:N-acyl-L-homoserine lactone synthetase